MIIFREVNTLYLAHLIAQVLDDNKVKIVSILKTEEGYGVFGQKEVEEMDRVELLDKIDKATVDSIQNKNRENLLHI